MVVVADASIAIRGDLSGFHRDLQGAERQTQTLGERLRGALSPRNIIMGAGLIGVGLGLRSLVGYAGDAGAAFKELQQTQRTVNEVFGDSASVIEEWATRSARAAGMSQQTVFRSGAVMGQTLQNMGFSAAEAADKVVLLQQRAAEMAIAFGQTPERAILAITAAMRGERDTIEKFGVSIKQVDVNSRVAASGLDTSTVSTKKYAEAMAILDIVMEQTAAQGGRFAESQDDAAVKMAVAQARIDDFMATSFGPMVTSIQVGAVDVATAFADMAESGGEFFDEVFNPENQAKVQSLADSLDITFNEAGDLIRAGMHETGQTWDDTVDGMLASAYTLGEEGAESFDHFTAAMTHMRVNVEGEAALVADAIPAAVLANWQDIRQAGLDTMAAYNQGIFESQSGFIAEIDNLIRLLDENLAPAEEIALLRGRKVTLMHARGLNEGNPAAIAAINAMIAQINQRLNTLNGYQSGANVARTIAAGMYAEAWQVGQAAGYIASKIQGPLQIRSEPPDADSPLRGITRWGGNIVKTIAEGIYGELGTGAHAASALAGALVPGMAMPAMATAAGAVPANGGVTYQLVLNGVPKTFSSEEQMLDALKDLSAFGEGRLSGG